MLSAGYLRPVSSVRTWGVVPNSPAGEPDPRWVPYTFLVMFSITLLKSIGSQSQRLKRFEHDKSGIQHSLECWRVRRQPSLSVSDWCVVLDLDFHRESRHRCTRLSSPSYCTILNSCSINFARHYTTRGNHITELTNDDQDRFDGRYFSNGSEGRYFSNGSAGLDGRYSRLGIHFLSRSFLAGSCLIIV